MYLNKVDLGGYQPSHTFSLTGAYTLNTWSTSFFPIQSDNNGPWFDGTYGFDASKSNPIYGNSSTVQPPAIQLIPQIKY